jgi:hypothetical protein
MRGGGGPQGHRCDLSFQFNRSVNDGSESPGDEVRRLPRACREACQLASGSDRLRMQSAYWLAWLDQLVEVDRVHDLAELSFFAQVDRREFSSGALLDQNPLSAGVVDDLGGIGLCPLNAGEP